MWLWTTRTSWNGSVENLMSWKAYAGIFSLGNDKQMWVVHLYVLASSLSYCVLDLHWGAHLPARATHPFEIRLISPHSGLFSSPVPPLGHAYPCPRRRRQRTCPRLETRPVNLSRTNLLGTRQRRILSGTQGDQRRPQPRGFPRPRQVRRRQRGATSTFPPLYRIFSLIRLIS
jgi:hypothetical protein